MKHFAKNGIDYYFLRLNDYTDKMCYQFQAAFKEAVGDRGRFKVIKGGAAPYQFCFSVMSSIKSSIWKEGEEEEPPSPSPFDLHNDLEKEKEQEE